MLSEIGNNETLNEPKNKLEIQKVPRQLFEETVSFAVNYSSDSNPSNSKIRELIQCSGLFNEDGECKYNLVDINSDPKIIAIFLNFADECIKMKRINQQGSKPD